MWGNPPPARISTHTISLQDLEIENADRRVVEAVAKIAHRKVRRAQIAHAWVLSKSEISAPIIGATKLLHLEDAVAVLGITLTAAEIQALEINYVPHTVVGFS